MKKLVLIGGGHSHVEVLRRLGAQPEPSMQLILIGRERHTPYSGMIPGYLAGHYQFAQVHIDLVPMAHYAKAEYLQDEVVGLDLQARRIHCRGGASVAYDFVSLDTGSTPILGGVPGAEGNVVPVKPISNFLARWQALCDRVRAATGLVRIAVVGGGAGGVEVALAAQYALKALVEVRAAGTEVEFHLFAGGGVLPTHNPGVRRRFQRVLRERKVAVHDRLSVASVAPGELTDSCGTRFKFDEILWVTQAGAASWIAQSGLAVDDRGFIRVADTLESVSQPGVFAAGDVAHVVNHPREKAGVFAVRQGPPLEANLRRALRGQPLEPFIPQEKFLSIISTGDRYAVASRGNWSAEGHWVWRWKDWIDRRFMARYHSLLPQE